MTLHVNELTAPTTGQTTITTGPDTRLVVARWDTPQGRALVAITPEYRDRYGVWKLAHSAVSFPPSDAAEVAAAVLEVAAAVLEVAAGIAELRKFRSWVYGLSHRCHGLITDRAHISYCPIAHLAGAHAHVGRQGGHKMAMRSELREAEGSRPDRPLWLWRVWRNGKVIAEGFEPTREDAEAQLERASAIAEARQVREPGWGGRL